MDIRSGLRQHKKGANLHAPTLLENTLIPCLRIGMK